MPRRNMVRRQDDRSYAQIEDGAQQNRADTAEAVEEGLRDAAAQERDTQGESPDQDSRGAERGAQLDQARLDPRASAHCKNSYITNVNKKSRRSSLRLAQDDGISLIPPAVRRQVARARVGRFATSRGDQLGLVPVCFVLVDDTLYHAIDAKPKRREAAELARVANVRANPRAVLLVDHYEEDWRRLWYALFRGRARLLETPGEERRRAIAALRRKYVQYRDSLPLAADAIVIGLDVEQLRHWEASSAGRRRSDRRDWRA